MAEPRDFYEILGVPRTANQKEIQRSYRKLARTYHPDVNKDPAAEERFKEVSEAYDVLSDPELRRRYDTFGRDFRQVPEGMDSETWQRVRSGAGRRQATGQRAGAGRGQREGESVFYSSDFGDGDFSFSSGDIDIDDLLGGIFSGRSRAGRGFGPMPGADQEAELTLTVEEAFAGGRRTVTLSTRGGQRTFEVNIPAGVANGQRIRLAGQGGQGSGGAQAGDLYLVVRLAPHPRYRVDGRDITVELRLAPWEAALGASVTIEGPGGEARLKVPAGTSSGRRLRLKGRGLPNPKGKPGDLYAEAKIMVPPRLNAKERDLFEQLAAVSDFDPEEALVTTALIRSGPPGNRSGPGGNLLDLQSFAAAAVLHPEFVVRLVNLGLLEASPGPGAGATDELWFSPAQLAVAARIQRLRSGLALNYAALGVVIDLLDRVTELETALRKLQRGGRTWTRTV